VLDDDARVPHVPFLLRILSDVDGRRRHALFTVASMTLRLVPMAPRLSRRVHATHHDPRPLVTRGRAVPLLEPDVSDGAGLADDGRRIGAFDDRIARQVEVKLLLGVPVPVELLIWAVSRRGRSEPRVRA
jgi:hypothetical protein